MTPGQRHDLWQRDKEIRANILGALFGRIVWVDAAAIAVALGAVAELDAVDADVFMCWGLGLFAVSLLAALVAAWFRYIGSFNRSEFNLTSTVLMWIAMGGTFIATLLVVGSVLT